MQPPLHNGSPLKPMKYVVEIYHPGNPSNVLASFASSGPFLAIQAGDVLNPRTWGHSARGDLDKLEGRVLMVVSVDHLLWENAEAVTHKTLLYTVAFEDTDHFRQNRAMWRFRYGRVPLSD
jgi:hypothetical protein